VTGAEVNRRATPQVGQSEVDAPVAAEGRAEEGEKRLILVDGEELAVTLRPALWGKVEAEDSYLSKERFCHVSLLSRMCLVIVSFNWLVEVEPPGAIAGGQ
jgi:hypothetical protein